MKYGFGIDLGGTTVKLAFFDETGVCLDKWEIPTVTDSCGSQILPHIARSVLSYLEENNIAKASVFGIGIGVPGPVTASGVVRGCINLGWGDKDVPAQLHTLTGLPAVCGNDANMAALGECAAGAGNPNMIFVTLGTGVGGGVVIDGKILPGVHGAGGEIGHITICREETAPCNCGRCGCAEQYLSATGIVRLARKALASRHTPSLMDSGELTAKTIFDAGKEKDALALAVLDRYFDLMGQFLSALCCITDPEVIVFGGGVSKAGQLLLDGAEKAFRKYAFAPCRDTRLALATLGNDAGVHGAFHLAKQNFL